MASQSDESIKENAEQDVDLGGGNYELIRRRLLDQNKILHQKIDVLNARRKEIFGNTELTIIGNSRIITPDKRIPRDMLSINGQLLFGFNVTFGLKQSIPVDSVFTLHRFEQSGEDEFHFPNTSFADGLNGSFDNAIFKRNFEDFHQFSKNARLLTLRMTKSSSGDPRLLAIFQKGRTPDEIQVFRWAIGGDSQLRYIDNRGERDHIFPDSHDFEWTQTTSADELNDGPHPHVSILDKVFVETIGGDLTVKVEDNSEDGKGIYSEPVDEADQTLSDGKFFYAELGTLILLKILPYRERDYRYLVFNTRTQDVLRIDAIGQACISLPEDHGIVFPGGYYLRSGDYKIFDHDISDLIYKRTITSPGNEDVMFVFHHAVEGLYVLLPYNLIEREAQAPTICHGYSIFDDGKMVIFRVATEEPSTHHPIQIWQTPFTTQAYAAAAPTDGSYLSKIGSPTLVNGIGDAKSICRLIEREDPTRLTYEDLISASRRLMDSYFWLKHKDAGDLYSTLENILHTTELIIDEFEKIIAFRKRAVEALEDIEKEQRSIFSHLRTENFRTVDEFLNAMTKLRTLRGRLATLKEVRFINLERLVKMDEESIEKFDRVSKDCVSFLLRDEAMKPLISQLEEIEGSLKKIEKANEIDPLILKIGELNEGLNLLSEVISTIEVQDTTIRTRILEMISEVFSQLNRTRAQTTNRRKFLLGREGRDEFAAQFKLFSQSVSSALSMCDTPERCDEQLSRLMIQLEELEGKFSDFDEFLGDLADKREEVSEALNNRKQTLVDERQRRAQNLMSSAERILAGIQRRAATFKKDEELHAYFASDAMVMKLRQTSKRLLDLNDSVRSDELESKLKASKQEAIRGLRDRLELFVGGKNVIKFGDFHFNVNVQPLDITLVPRGDDMAIHLTGTDFYQVIDDEEFNATRDYWQQALVSERPNVYRGEYLASKILFAAEDGAKGLSIEKLTEAQCSEGGLLQVVRKFADERYDEGYERGIHDVDSTQILERLLAMRATAGLLRFSAQQRSMACLFWAFYEDKQQKELWQRRGHSFGLLRKSFANSSAFSVFGKELSEHIGAFFEKHSLSFTEANLLPAGRYLLEELTVKRPVFATNAEAESLREALFAHLDRIDMRSAFNDDMRALERNLNARYSLAFAWVEAFVGSDPELESLTSSAEETTTLILTERRLDREVNSARTQVKAQDLLGQHPSIKEGGELTIRLDEFLGRLREFSDVHVPGFRSYRKARTSLLERERYRLRIEEFKPRVMTSFVRNRLINEVYLPMVGSNLAKQIGALGDKKRTDLMGLLLLISPPGYGKTTLMEYISNRLGLVFMKINGPSLGHNVISLDPSEAPNATAAQEVIKINLALEMGNNVMLYLDDIQHTNPELLQKFISLCDGQRKIEGVWKGRTRTYDMRGKKFCVVMAGNPYTETGEKFQIPDMLANRADTYNLGDILDGREEVFALSFIENALTSNPALAPLATRDQADIYKLIRMAKGEEIPTSDLKYGYSSVELSEITSIFKKLFRVQEVLLKVNLEYIASAAQDDRFRTEPPFKMQGSYRNMSKVTEKVVSAMNDRELEALLVDHYVGESQTLTTGAENNLLKFHELRGFMSDDERARWVEIKKNFKRLQLMGGSGDDPISRVTGSLGGISDYLDGINTTLQAATERKAEQTEVATNNPWDAGLEKLGGMLSALGRPQLEVTIDHQPPPGVDQILAQQIAIIEHTLVPLVRTTTQHLTEGLQIDAKLKELLQLLRAQDQKIQSASVISNQGAARPAARPTPQVAPQVVSRHATSNAARSKAASSKVSQAPQRPAAPAQLQQTPRRPASAKVLKSKVRSKVNRPATPIGTPRPDFDSSSHQKPPVTRKHLNVPPKSSSMVSLEGDWDMDEDFIEFELSDSLENMKPIRSSVPRKRKSTEQGLNPAENRAPRKKARKPQS